MMRIAFRRLTNHALNLNFLGIGSKGQPDASDRSVEGPEQAQHVRKGRTAPELYQSGRRAAHNAIGRQQTDEGAGGLPGVQPAQPLDAWPGVDGRRRGTVSAVPRDARQAGHLRHRDEKHRDRTIRHIARSSDERLCAIRSRTSRRQICAEAPGCPGAPGDRVRERHFRGGRLRRHREQSEAVAPWPCCSRSRSDPPRDLRLTRLFSQVRPAQDAAGFANPQLSHRPVFGSKELAVSKFLPAAPRRGSRDRCRPTAMPSSFRWRSTTAGSSGCRSMP